MNANELKQVFGAAPVYQTSTGGTSDKPESKSLTNDYYIDSDGNKQSLAGKKAQITRFEGKTGSARRSRKGRTYRLPNGRRSFNYLMDGEVEMIAYKV